MSWEKPRENLEEKKQKVIFHSKDHNWLPSLLNNNRHLPQAGNSLEHRVLLELLWDKHLHIINLLWLLQLWEQLRDHPQQKAALAASDGREGWISWRELRRYYALWEAPQLMRRAPAVSKPRGALPRALVPFASMQVDCMDMGSWARPAGRARLASRPEIN